MDEPRTPVRDALAEVIAERARKRYRPSADDLIALHEGGLSEEEAERVLDYLALHPEEAQAVAAFDEDDFALPRPGEVELTESELEARLAALKKQAALTVESKPEAEAVVAPSPPSPPAGAPGRPKTFRWQKLAAVLGWLVVGLAGGSQLFRPAAIGPTTEVELAAAESRLTRSAQEAKAISTDRVELKLPFVNEHGFTRFRMEMRAISDGSRRSAQSVETFIPGGCKPGSECQLSVSVGADLLVGRTWSFELYGLDDREPFRIKTFEESFRDARP